MKERRNLSSALLHGRNYYSRAIQTFLHHHGHKHIETLIISRDPIPKILQKTLKTFGGISPYDKLFHLRLIGTTMDGVKFMIEKNQNLNIGKKITGITKHNETIPINLNNTMPLSEFLNNGLQLMGVKKYFSYSVTNNCQVYIKSLLIANGYHNSKFIEFVKQDTRSIFKDKPILRKFVNTLTDVAGRSEILFNGGKLLYNTNNMNTITLNLTNAQIDRLMKKQNFRVNKTQIVGMDDEQCNCHLEVDPLIYQNSRKKTGAGFLVPTQGGRINVLRAVKRFAKNKIVRAIAKNKTVRAVAKSKIAKKVGKTGINLVLGQLNNAGLISDNQENQL